VLIAFNLRETLLFLAKYSLSDRPDMLQEGGHTHTHTLVKPVVMPDTQHGHSTGWVEYFSLQCHH